MNRRTRKIAAALGLSGVMALSSPAIAQSAEETVNVGLEVAITPPPPGISRLDDLTIGSFIANNFNFLPISIRDEFCIYVPGAENFEIHTSGTNVDAESAFDQLTLADTSSGTDSKIHYSIEIRRISTSSLFDETIHRTSGRVGSSAVRSIFLLRPTGHLTDCDGSNNVVFKFRIDLRENSPNRAVLDGLTPGQSYTFSDQLSLIVTPVI